MMDRSRQGELARAYAKSQLRDKGIRVDNSVERALGNEVKDLNSLGLNPPATSDEVLEFYAILATEVFEEFKTKVDKKLKK